MLTNKDLGVIVKSIQRRTNHQEDERKSEDASYVGEADEMEINGRRLNPLDSLEFNQQYVSGMANGSSHRESLNHRL